MTVAPESIPASLPTDLIRDTLVHAHLAEALNLLLAETEQREGRLPMALNAHGQWCTYGIGGWRPHCTYMDAYHAAHADEIA